MTVRVTRPSRSSPRRLSVSMRCEMPSISRFSSEKRRGPLRQDHHDQHAPLVADAVEHRGDILAAGRLQAGAACVARASIMRVGHIFVPGYQIFAFLQLFHSWLFKVPPVTNQYQGPKHDHPQDRQQHHRREQRQPPAHRRHPRPARRRSNPDATVVARDLAAEPLDHLTLGAFADTDVLDEFLAADTVVIGAPMYNFGVPSQLKAWIDRIAVAGKTFRYGDDGRPSGLAGDKRVIVAISRGGFYDDGNAMEHVETYLRGVFRFIGVDT